MQEQKYEKKEGKLKPYRYKIAEKPVIKSKKIAKGIEKGQIITKPEISSALIERAEKKVGIIPPTTIKRKIKSVKAYLPVFKSKKTLSKPVSEQQIESIATEFNIKTKVREQLKGSIEELLPEPQKLKTLSSEMKEPEETTVKTDFDTKPLSIEPTPPLPIKPPEIELTQFMSSTPKTDFDTTLPKVESPIKHRPAVPIFSATQSPEVTTRDNFDKNVSPQIIELISKIKVAEEIGAEEKEITTPVEKTVEEELTITETLDKEEMATANVSEGGIEEELFERFIKSSTGNFPKGISNKKPVLIILSKSDDDDYASSIQIICREIFHELVGGLPTSRIRSKGKKDVKEDWSAEGKIEFIDDSGTKHFKPTSSKIKTINDIESEVKWDVVGDKLKEFYAQGFGFVIFQIPKKLVQDFKKKLEEVTGDLRPQIIELYPKGIYVTELKRDISSAFWGFVIPKDGPRWKEGGTFDNFFTACENEFYERLNKIGRDDIKVGKKKLSPSFLVNLAENEDDIHYWIKVFIVKYLVEKENYEREMIKTEEDAALTINEKKVIPDIKVGDRLVIEVETLYGTGLKYHEPLNKIRTETIKKYKDNEKDFDVWIVLKNLDLFFYYKDLKKLKKSAKEEWNVNIEFFGLDLDEQKLVPLDDFKKYIPPSRMGVN